MPAVSNKQRLLSQLFSLLKKRNAAAEGEPEPRPVLEQLIYAICREGTTRNKADKAFRNLRERFFDWNEIRVSSVREVEEAFEDMPRAELRAQRLIHLLQEVFETTFSFDLETLHKKGVKQAAKQLSRYEATNDHTVAWVVQQSLGGHAIPLDESSLRVVRRLGLIDSDSDDLEAIRASLEHLVPKPRGLLFNDLVSDLANDVCWETPHCPACPLKQDCPTGRANAKNERPARAKPR
jgi:endonuclease-3